MSDRKRYLMFGGPAALAAGLAIWLPAAAGASSTNATPPTPESTASCGGALSPDPGAKAAGEPYLLDYRFTCDTAISAYTIIVDRLAGQGGNIDDYSPTATVFGSDGTTVSTTQSFTCEGSTPSDGINCNAGPGGLMSIRNIAAGSVDPVEAYCKHLPAKARPGTPAVPRAIVQIVVTDSSGAQDGPFALGEAKPCPKVANFVPAPKPKKVKKATKRSVTRKSVRAAR